MIRSRKVLFLYVVLIFGTFASGYGAVRKFKSESEKREWARQYPLHALVMDIGERPVGDDVDTAYPILAGFSVLRDIGKFWDHLSVLDDEQRKPENYAPDSPYIVGAFSLIEEAPLASAAYSGNIDWVIDLVKKQKKDVNEEADSIPGGAVPLVFAIRAYYINKTEEVIRYLLRCDGIDVHKGGMVVDEVKPITVAVGMGIRKVIGMLLKAGANPDHGFLEAVRSYGRKSFYPLLYKAVSKKRSLEIMNFLLKNGADPNFFDSYSGKTVLFEALEKGSSVVEFLLKAGAKPDLQLVNEKTPLYYVVNEGLIDIAEVLLKYKANPKYKASSDLDSPLQRAERLYEEAESRTDRVLRKEMVELLKGGERWGPFKKVWQFFMESKFFRE